MLNDDYKVESNIISLTNENYNKIVRIFNEIQYHRDNPSLLNNYDPYVSYFLKMSETKKINGYFEIIRSYNQNNIDIISYWDSNYPSSLKKITNPPLVLYKRGSIGLIGNNVAIVGTRDPSEKGRELAHDFAKKLVEKDCTIVSGLAIGIDSSAHMGALDGAGKTIAILGNNISSIFHKENVILAERIAENEVIISEMTEMAYMHKGRFIERNRIISGISNLVIVAESSRDGGTIHQAKFAIEQRKPLFVIDHKNFSNQEAKAGFERLKKMGAIPITSPAEALAGKPKGHQLKIIE